MKKKRRWGNRLKRRAQLKRLREEFKLHALKLALVDDHSYRLIVAGVTGHPVNEYVNYATVLRTINVVPSESNWRLLLTTIKGIQEIRDDASL